VFAGALMLAVGGPTTVNEWPVSLEGAYVLLPAKRAVIWYGLSDGESSGVTAQLAAPELSVVAEQDSAPNPRLTLSPAIPCLVAVLVSVADSVA
jgi:hypothetical protein